MVAENADQGNGVPSEDEPFYTEEERAEIAKYNASLDALPDKEEAKALAKLAESFGSWEDVTQAWGGELETIGDFELVEDKDELLGKEFVIAAFIFRPSDITRNGIQQKYVTVYAMTKDSEKIVFNDGSTGIAAQLQEIQDRTGKRGGIYCKRGLRKSEYDYIDEKGDKSPATTYYLT